MTMVINAIFINSKASLGPEKVYDYACTNCIIVYPNTNCTNFVHLYTYP